MMVNSDHMLMLYKTNVGQEEDKMRKELHISSLRNPACVKTNFNKPYDSIVCQEEYADAQSHPEMDQLRHLIAQQSSRIG